MIAWFVRNGIAANLLMLFTFFVGLFCLFRLIPLEILPTYEADTVSVNMQLRGATPEDVEQGITIRIEEALDGLNGIEKITSVSSEGRANVIVEASSGYNVRALLADIKSEIDGISSFPDDAEKPIVSLNQKKKEVIAVTLSSIYGEKELREYAENIRRDILSINGITQVELVGVRDYEISIDISKDTLQQYNLSINDIVQAIKQSSTDLSSGNLKTSGGDIFVRTKAQAYYKNDFAQLKIRTLNDGSHLYLEDIANIKDVFEETPVRTRFNGKNAILLEVYRIGLESSIDVATKVKTFIAKKQSTLPQGYKLNYWDDDSKGVVNRLSTLTNSAIQGGLLVLILLTLFLRPAIAFWVFIGIPISFMGAFIIMPFFDVTFNVFSLFGFILVLGIVVDDAIVTGENIHSHIQKSGVTDQAIILGTKEISTPVTFGVFTTIAAFVPLFFIEGNRSEFFSQIPFVVIPILLFSLIESKLILPSHLRKLKTAQNNQPINKLEQLRLRFSQGFEQKTIKHYLPLLDKCIRNKRLTLTVFICAFVLITSAIFSGWLKFTFFPRIPGETVRANLTMPVGTSFEITNKYIAHMAEKAEYLKEKYINESTGESIVLGVLATTGKRGGNGHLGSVKFEIMQPDELDDTISISELAKEWRELVGEIPGADALAFRFERGGGDSPIDIQLMGASLNELSLVAEKIKQHLTGYQTVFDIKDSLSDGKKEYLIELTDKGRALGLSRLDVSMQVRNALFGSEVQRIQRGREDVRVMVRLPLNERMSLDSLGELQILSSTGKQTPFSQIAQFNATKGPSTITRADHYRTVNITADIDKSTTNMAVLTPTLELFLDELIAKYPDVQYSFEGEAREQRETLSSLL